MLDRPGFANPVDDAQACFRAVLDAMSRPGRILTVGASLDPPPPLQPAAAAVLLTLVDVDTPVWLDPALAGGWPWLAFHCGAGAAGLDAAAFVVSDTLPSLDALHRGTDEAPEAGATVLLQLPRLGAGRPWRLDGPGLPGPATAAIEGLPDDFAPIWQANRALFPRGVDLLLCSGESLMALPRTVAVG